MATRVEITLDDLYDIYAGTGYRGEIELKHGEGMGGNPRFIKLDTILAYAVELADNAITVAVDETEIKPKPKGKTKK